MILYTGDRSTKKMRKVSVFSRTYKETEAGSDINVSPRPPPTEADCILANPGSIGGLAGILENFEPRDIDEFLFVNSPIFKWN